MGGVGGLGGVGGEHRPHFHMWGQGCRRQYSRTGCQAGSQRLALGRPAYRPVQCQGGEQALHLAAGGPPTSGGLTRGVA